MQDILAEAESLAIKNSERGIGRSTADITIEEFFDGAEDYNTPHNRAAVVLHYRVTYDRHFRAIHGN